MHHRLPALSALSLLLVLACSSDPATPSSNGGAGAPPSTAGAAGALAGAGGTPSAGAPATSGGAGAGTGGAPITAGSGGTAGGSAGASTGIACPADATFCSGFEDSALPMGAVYKANAAPGEWTRDFEVDSTVFRGGKSALRVKDSTEAGVSGAYRMLAVPAPSGTFWVRFYIRQAELDIGGKDHNVFASAALGDDPNTPSIEFAEDVGVSFNTSDAVRWPVGYGRTMSGGEMPYTLAKGMWHCIEISYDSQARAQKLYIEGVLKIDATDYPATGALNSAIKNFKIGFNQLHGPTRKVWYDDVAVGPTRAGCL